MAVRKERIFNCCGKVSLTFSRAESCAECSTKNKKEALVKVHEQQLRDWGYPHAQFVGYDPKFKKLLFNVMCPKCKFTQDWKFEHIRHRISVDNTHLPCKKCGKKRRTEQAHAVFMAKHGRDYVNIDYNRWDEYKESVRKLSDQNFKKHQDILNPHNLVRGMREYHLDHIVPIAVCFRNGIDVQVAASIENLELIPAGENLSAGGKYDPVKLEALKTKSAQRVVVETPTNFEELRALFLTYTNETSQFAFLKSAQFYAFARIVEKVQMPDWGSLEEKIYAIKHNLKIKPKCKCGLNRAFFNNRLLSTCIACSSKTKFLNVLQYEAPKFKDAKINIWPHQLLNERLIMSMIAHKRGTSKKIHARSTLLSVIDVAQARSFLKDNHLAGYAASTHNFGLFYRDELVMVVTIAKPRFSKEYDWEVIRLATLAGVVVVGGASKCFSFIKKNFNGTLLSYSDNLLGSGGVYAAAGFLNIGETGQGYFWEKDGNVLSRHATQKHKLPALLGDIDMTKTEKALMVEAGWRLVHDAGNSKWLLNLNGEL